MGIDVLDSPATRPQRREPMVPNGVLGMVITIVAEIMFFTGLISAFVIAKAGAVGGVWPPYGQPTLPANETAFNTAALLLSGVLLVVAHVRFKRSPRSAWTPFFASFGLGILFVGFQGVEWAQLLAQGLTLTSSQAGGFFYLIVGAHALHAIVALLGLGWVGNRLVKGCLHNTELLVAEMFWIFVVALWPVIYALVYF